MKHTSFAALSVDERNAVIDALRRSGVDTRQVCVSKLDPDEPSAAECTAPAVTMVTTPDSCFSYEGGAQEPPADGDLASPAPPAAD